MKIKIKINATNQLIVELQGRLDTVNVKILESNIDSILKGTHTHIIINCQELDYVSSSGLRLLLFLKKESLTQGRLMTLRSVQPAVMSVFQMTGFDKLFTIED